MGRSKIIKKKKILEDLTITSDCVPVRSASLKHEKDTSASFTPINSLRPRPDFMTPPSKKNVFFFFFQILGIPALGVFFG